MEKQLSPKRGRGGYLEALLTGSAIAIIAIDADGTITFANDETSNLTERSLQELVGESCAEVVYDNLDDARETNRKLYQNHGKIRDHETTVRTKSGKIVAVRLSAAHLKDSTGQYIGAVGFFEEYRPWTAAEKRTESYAKELEAKLKEWRILGAPITELYPGLSVLFLGGSVDSNRFQTVSTDLMNHLKTVKSRVVLIDLSAANIKDNSIAAQLTKTIRTVNLLGTECVIGGIQLELAKALEPLVSNVGTLRSYSSAKAALESALDVIGLRICPKQ